jgi:hypothetical protein
MKKNSEDPIWAVVDRARYVLTSPPAVSLLSRVFDMNSINSWPLRAWRWAVSWFLAPRLGWSRRAVCVWGGGSLKVRERPKNLHFKCNLLSDHPKTRVLTLTISGFYPPGSAGNEHGTAIEKWVTDKIRESQPAAVLYDLTGLDYVWGDEMFGITGPLSSGILVVYLATGRTAKALNSLFLAFWPGWRKKERRIFQDRDEALLYLKAQLPRVDF